MSGNQDSGREWIEYSEERQQQLVAVYGRLAGHGILPGSADYDEATLVNAVEDRRREVAAFVEPDGYGFYAWVDEHQAFQAEAYGWTPVVALARAIDAFLAVEPWRQAYVKRG